jgi:hypothetical protein
MKETKEQRMQRKWRESIPLENAERKAFGRPSSSVKTAERMLYDQSVNKEARREFRFKK